MEPRERIKQLDGEMRGALGDVLQAQAKLVEARGRYRAALDKMMRLIDAPDPVDDASITSRVDDVVASSPSEIHTGDPAGPSVAPALG